MSGPADYRVIWSELFGRAVDHDARLLVLALAGAGLDGHLPIGDRFGAHLHEHLGVSERHARKLVREAIDAGLLSALSTVDCLVLLVPEVQSGSASFRPSRCEARHANDTERLSARAGRNASLRATLLDGAERWDWRRWAPPGAPDVAEMTRGSELQTVA